MKNIRKILASGLLILFIGYVGSVTLFYHSHTVNGQRITHSHPYSSTPDTENHTHTSSELASIAALSVLLMLAVSFVSSFGIFYSQYTVISAWVNNFIYSRKPLLLSLRGPPAC